MTHTGMFLYPWDIESNFEDFKASYEKTGCDSVAVALSYHHATILSPRHQRCYELPHACLSFYPHLPLYGALQPQVNENSCKNTFAIRNWCKETGRLFTGWAVYLHNSTLGTAHPEICVKNAWDNVLQHTLFPSNEAVLAYTLALTQDMITQLCPDYIAAESLTPRTFLHGGHHEIMSIQMDAVVTWMLSICFCDGCMKKAADHGIDAITVKQDVSRLLHTVSCGEFAIDGDAQARITSILFAYPELYRYLHLYQQTVAHCVTSNYEAALRSGTVMKIIPSATPYTIDQTYAESLNMAALNGKGYHYLPLVYGANETLQKVTDLIHLYDETAVVSMGISLSANRFQDKDRFLSFLKESAAVHPAFVYYYNYSIATSERLSWVSAANAYMK